MSGDRLRRVGQRSRPAPMTRRVVVRSLVTAVLVTGLVIALVIATRSSDGDSPAPAATPTCPPPRQVPGVVVSHTRPVVDAGAGQVTGQTAFVPNVGQADRGVRYYAADEGFGVYATDDGIAMAFASGGRSHVLRLVPLATSGPAKIEPRSPLPGRTSLFVGRRHAANLPRYAEIAYRDLWPGIDLVLRADPHGLKYEFDVAAGADPARIGMAYRGADGVTLSAAGDLVVDTPLGPVRDARPTAYQEAAGVRIAVGSRFAVDERTGRFGVSVDAYDRNRPLVIDPGVELSTLVGGTATDFVRSIAVDDVGNMYVAGGTMSGDLPVTSNAPGPVYLGEPDAFVAKLDADGALIYQTYIGGRRSETALSIAVDDAGNAYVSGGSNSDDFPTTPGAFARHEKNEDVWVVKLDPTGSSLVYSTFLPGSAIAGDFGNAVAVDGSGHAYVAGGSGSADFPTTKGAFDSTHNGEVNALDAFVAKLEPDGSGLVYSTLIGGTCNDVANGISVGPSGTVHVIGSTASEDFPTTAGRRYRGGEDVFVAELSADGAALDRSAMLGGRALDSGRDITVDRDGNRYVTGWTQSPDFPTTPRAYDTTFNGAADAFVAKLSGDRSRIVYSTYLGGELVDEGWGVGVDGDGAAYVAGLTASQGFPAAAGAIDATPNGDQDAFVAMLDASGSALVASTFVGGDGLDAPRAFALGESGAVYLAGRTSSTNFPSAAGTPMQLRGERDGFVVRLRLR